MVTLCFCRNKTAEGGVFEGSWPQVGMCSLSEGDSEILPGPQSLSRLVSDLMHGCIYNISVTDWRHALVVIAAFSFLLYLNNNLHLEVVHIQSVHQQMKI